MKRRILLITLFIFSFIGSYGQVNEHQRERIHALKMAYITDKLQLTERQSNEFIPIYREMEMEIKGIRKEFREKHKELSESEGNDSITRQYIDDNLDYQEKVISIRRKYNDRFLKCITVRQLAELPAAEREFNKFLIKQMQKRGGREERGERWYRPNPNRGY